MVTISSEKDRVILAFASRGRDLCMRPDVAQGFVEAVRKAAQDCDIWVTAGGTRELIRGEQRGALVKSWDGKVNVRFNDVTDRESIPYEAARRLADEVEAKIPEAEARTTILWVPRPGMLFPDDLTFHIGGVE